MNRAACVLAASALALAPLALWAQEQPKTAPTKKGPKVEDVASRALKRAKERDNLKLARVTMAPNDDGETLVVTEFASGEIGVFVGGLDPSEDQFIVATKENVSILREAMARTEAVYGWHR